MVKENKREELYEAPASRAYVLAARRCIAISQTPDEYNPGGYVPDMQPGEDL